MRFGRRATHVRWLPAILVFALVGCTKRDDRRGRDSGRETWNVARGIASFLVRGKRQVTKGAVYDVRGTFEVDFADITRTHGTLSMDLASLATSSFEDDAQNRKQASDVRSWLGVAGSGGPADSGDPERWATFTIREIASAEPRALSGDAGSPRKVRAKARGDLTLHGRTVSREVDLEATVAFEGGRARSMFVQTLGDLVIPLSACDLHPREGDEFAESAEVGLQLAAEPTPR
jgi:hypothetical protein